jgi:hypothetical protein
MAAFSALIEWIVLLTKETVIILNIVQPCTVALALVWISDSCAMGKD